MISVVIPCYNAEKCLDRAVKSVQDQTESEFELILVDDGSTDGTPGLCDLYASEDYRIKVIHQENKGLMGAWKTGVKISSGEYIIFCDSDDYVASDLIKKVTEKISKYHADLILYGFIYEYEKGDMKRVANRMDEGFYSKEDVDNKILPVLFSNGKMQSEIMFRSRCSKAFKRSNLMNVIDDLPENVSVGEDSLTTFAVVLNIGSLYCMGDYCPYHYVRNEESMIGCFDEKIFDKLEILYSETDRLAKKYSYRYSGQILSDRLSVTLVYVKKYICKSKSGYSDIKKVLKTVRDGAGICECINECSIDEYSFETRIFADWFVKYRFLFMYVFARLFEMIRGRNV